MAGFDLDKRVMAGLDLDQRVMAGLGPATHDCLTPTDENIDRLAAASPRHDKPASA
jgi:hypothetical protein